MSADAVAVIQQFNESMVAGELRWDLIDSEIDIEDHDIPDAGAYHGHQGLAKWIQEDWGSAWESYEIEPEELVDAGDVVVSIFTVTARGKGSGIEIRRRNATVNTVANGRVTRIEYYSTVEEAREAAGLTAAGRD
jgi:ketosteroid isomerase-like protein